MLGVPPPFDGLLWGVPPPFDGSFARVGLGVIELIDDVFEYCCLLLECPLVVCASACANEVQMLVDDRQRLVGDFLKWNDELGVTVECNQVNPCTDWLMLNGLAVAFRVENFHESSDCIDCLLYFLSVH